MRTDIVPIKHTKYKSSKRPNRINREQKLMINKLYVEKDIYEISSIINKPVAAIEKYLKENKML